MNTQAVLEHLNSLNVRLTFFFYIYFLALKMWVKQRLKTKQHVFIRLFKDDF